MKPNRTEPNRMKWNERQNFKYKNQTEKMKQKMKKKKRETRSESYVACRKTFPKNSRRSFFPLDFVWMRRSIWAIFLVFISMVFFLSPSRPGVSHSFTLKRLHTAHNRISYICTQFCIHKNASSLWKFVGKWSWNENQRSSKRRKRKTQTFCIRINNNNNGMVVMCGDGTDFDFTLHSL